MPAAAEAFEEAGRRGAFRDRRALAGRRRVRLCAIRSPETLGLAASGRALGAIAVSPFGAGFGGSVWALVETGTAERFRAAWRDEHRRSFPGAAPSSEFFLTRAGPGRLRLN